MDDWRRNQSKNYSHHHHVVPRQQSRVQTGKPPLGTWRPAVPSWEKKFCYTVGSFTWRRLLESQKVMSLYKNVIQWNDSAGEEAFYNAKTRFWAEINGFPCDISLPNPDIYIDEIDWNVEIDPELLLDLERQPAPPVEEEKEGKVEFIGDSLFFMNQPIICSGWGDAEDDLIRTGNDSSPGPNLGDCDDKVPGNADNPWERFYVERNESGLEKRNGDVVDNTWGDCGDESWGWNHWNGNHTELENMKSWRANESWGTWNDNRKRQQSNNQNVFKHKNARFHSDDYQTDHWRRNGRGRKRATFAYEPPKTDKKPLAPREWNASYSCGPVTHRGCDEMRYPWNCEKQVL